jgi:FlaA1/EpsC-like NDP-sugar epimerase
MKNLLIASPLKRFIFFFSADIFLICFSLYLAFLNHFEFNFHSVDLTSFYKILPYFIILKLSALAAFRVYKITWRYFGLSDLNNIFLSLVVSELILVVLSQPSSVLPRIAIIDLPKSVFLVDGILSFGLIAALRASRRLYLEVVLERRFVCKGKNTLIIGAGNTGEMMLRDLARNGFKDFNPIGFLDDNPTKIGSYIHGVKIMGTTDQLAKIVLQFGVQAIIIAIPRLNHKLLRRLYEGARKAGVQTIKIVPRIYDFSRPEINMKTLESISIEDLVGRQSITVDCRGIGEFIRGKSILVTGAGGSIGSEIVVQICAFAPKKLILFDIDETELHNLGIKLKRMFPQILSHVSYVTGDVRDESRIREVFDAWWPEIVFHAAAYKHVPMMEHNPKEAVKVNIFGTFRVASAAKAHSVEKFIMISTDKAVRPTSVMGATKRMAELICSAFNEKNKKHSHNPEIKPPEGRIPRIGSTQFISVRFGNVLGSRGSVLPLFMEQLKYGGPLTVTHRDMQRYFMTIPEAVSLVLQASILGNGGEVFVFDMGKPAKILDIAEELIRIHGMEPYRDIDIQFTEKRPGEKLFEEILSAEEGTDASRHEKIFIARNGAKYSLEILQEILNEFTVVIADPSPESHSTVKLLLKKYIKYYVAPDEAPLKAEAAEALRN